MQASPSTRVRACCLVRLSGCKMHKRDDVEHGSSTYCASATAGPSDIAGVVASFVPHSGGIITARPPDTLQLCLCSHASHLALTNIFLTLIRRDESIKETLTRIEVVGQPARGQDLGEGRLPVPRPGSPCAPSEGTRGRALPGKGAHSKASILMFH